MSLSELDIAALHAGYQGGMSATAAIAALYRRIEAAGDPGIFIALVPLDQAMIAAAALGPFDPIAQPLWGIPFVVKDNIDVVTIATTAGCPEFAYTPTTTAPAIARLLAAGAILIGKTNLDQFATGLAGLRTPYPVPRNALDPTLVPGGSSSGSAVAVALGIVPFALGTDTAGSGRVPAALNGIVGLKPSRGAVSTRGVVPACRSLDCVSVFARSVEDAWRVFQVISAYDEADPGSRRFAFGDPVLPPAVRVGVPQAKSRIFGAANAAEAFDAAVALLPAEPCPVDLGAFFATGDLLYDGPWVAERYVAFGAFADAHPDALHPATRAIVERGKAIAGPAVFAALQRLAELARTAERTWADVDILMLPTIPDVCRPADVAADPFGSNRRLGAYSHFVNLLDLCAVSVPGPSRSDGLPAGVTFIAPKGRDALVAAVAAAFHATVRGDPDASLVKRPAAAPEGTIALAVVGAHLSGMALNGELTRRGATFVKAVATDARYRLYALPGGPPQRPGLVRVESDGASLATEVWALSPAAFGDFVAAIPSPLAIGTLRLADGTSVKGFLCESAAIAGAEDITRFGGWRAYIASR